MIIAGKYEVISELGRGGMGIVYQVRHLELGSIFALKVLRINLTEETTATVGRFYHEAQIMAQLRHPHIVQVFDIGKDENCHYFVMEYIQGRSLDEILKQEGHLPLSRVVAISTQIGQALAYAHAHQPPVVHRDIKPHNIMIEDGTGRVVVMDFGIAKLLDQQQTQYTGTGVFIGTLAYGAPEQMRSGVALDGRADIFSLGLVMYEMATGCKFFGGLSQEEIIGKQLYERGDYLPVFERQIPHAFRRLIAKAIAKNRDRRYRTVTELLDALAKVPVTGWSNKLAWALPFGGVCLIVLAAIVLTGEWPWRNQFVQFVEGLIKPAPKPEPPKPEPPKPEPPKPEPPKPEPPKPEFSKSELPKPEPPKPEPLKPELSKVEPPKPELPKFEPPKPEPSTPLTQPLSATPPSGRTVIDENTLVRILTAPNLPVTPPVGRITLRACESQSFSVNDNTARRYAWWINEQRQSEAGQRLLFLGQQAGKYKIRVAALGDDATGANWEVLVTPLPPSETEVRQWLETYRQALETQDLDKLRELGYVHSDQQADALREKFRARPQNQVQIQDWQAEAQTQEVRLNFQQADRWRDEATHSIVVDYSSQSVTLIRQDCTRIVAR